MDAADVNFINGTLNTALNGMTELLRSAFEPTGLFGKIFEKTAGPSESIVKIDPEYQKFLQAQAEAQAQNQAVSFISNTEKSKHETSMAPIRNIRVG